MTTFVDTSAFLALLNADDRYHETAAETWSQLLDDGEQLICNNYVLVETFALLQSRFGQNAVYVFQEDILPIITIRWMDESIHIQAVSALLAADRRSVSLVDWSQIEMMRLIGTKKIFTLDQHFKEYGLLPLP